MPAGAADGGAVRGGAPLVEAPAPAAEKGLRELSHPRHARDRLEHACDPAADPSGPRAMELLTTSAE